MRTAPLCCAPILSAPRLLPPGSTNNAAPQKPMCCGRRRRGVADCFGQWHFVRHEARRTKGPNGAKLPSDLHSGVTRQRSPKLLLRTPICLADFTRIGPDLDLGPADVPALNRGSNSWKMFEGEAERPNWPVAPTAPSLAREVRGVFDAAAAVVARLLRYAHSGRVRPGHGVGRPRHRDDALRGACPSRPSSPARRRRQIDPSTDRRRNDSCRGRRTGARRRIARPALTRSRSFHHAIVSRIENTGSLTP